ncbi:unnamed protein product [Brassica rapa subsp. narinosa]
MSEKSKSRGCFGWFIALIVLAAVILAVVYMVKSKMKKPDDNDDNEAGPVPGPPGAIDKKYADALKLALQFFDIQKSGKLVNNTIPWRGDSGLKDGSEANLDLSKGLYDAGDHIKFGFPMAFTATVLSWSILEYADQMDAVNLLDPAKESLKWTTDYFVKAHPSDNVLYIQVGDPEVDHPCWERPETMKGKRPVIKIDADTPGTEVAAETAAAMASASLVFKDSDPRYSATLLKHARQLFDFADSKRGLYSVNIPEVQKFYNSTGYGDELLWAASWLYHATEEKTYLDYVTKHGNEFARFGNPTWFSWDDKLAGTQVLLSRLLFFKKDLSGSKALASYRGTAKAVMCGLLPKSPTATASRSNSGLVLVSDWNPLQQSVSAAFLASLFSDYMLTSRIHKISCNGKIFKATELRDFAKSQADYILGKNPMGMSFVVGYGDKYPEYIHHRGASIPADATTGCLDGFKYFNSTKPNPNIAYGALVGGPYLNETFSDSRENVRQNEPTTYNNALLVGLLSSLVTTSSALQSLK